MATKKKLLQAASGSAGGGAAAPLNVEDVFSTHLYTGNGATQVIENGIKLSQSNDGGSARFLGTDEGLRISNNADFTLGSYYTLEAWVFPERLSGSQTLFGRWYEAVNNGAYVFWLNGGTLTGGVYPNYTAISASGSMSLATWHHVMFSYDGTTLRAFVNGTVVGTSTADHSVTSAGSIDFTVGMNHPSTAPFKGFIGDLRVRKFSSSSGVPTSAFTPPTSALTADSNTVLLTCQGSGPFVDNSASAHTIANEGAKASEFGPFDAAEASDGGMVWIKGRSLVSSHLIFDTERGATKRLGTNLTTAELTQTSTLTGFNSNGFSLGNDSEGTGCNLSGYTFASWTFRKAPKFFDVVTWSGNSTSYTQIPHNLGSVPACIIVKCTNDTFNWTVYHHSLNVDGDNRPETDYMVLNSTAAAADYNQIWSDTPPTDTHFTVGGDVTVNGSGYTYVAYLFAHNDGDGEFGPTGDQDIIKCGSYTGNGSDDGPQVNLGWEPQWLLVRRTDSANSWWMVDSMRGFTYNKAGGISGNPDDEELIASGTSRQTYNFFGPTATGFQVESSDADVNASGGTYIYMAIRRGDMGVPTDANKVFSVDLFDGTEPSTSPLSFNAGFAPDFVLHRGRYEQAFPAATGARLLGRNSTIYTTSAGAETDLTGVIGDGYIEYDSSDGVYIATGGYFNNSSTVSKHAMYSWKRANGYFDVTEFTPASGGGSFSHNLGVVPEMIWIKNRDASENWFVYHKDIGTGPANFLVLNDYTYVGSYGYQIFGTAPTETTIYHNNLAAGGSSYICYSFASVDGVSKIGSYTGDGTSDGSKVISCGFTNGARFVLVKRTNTNGNWFLFDAERGIVSGTEGFFRLNTTDAEITTSDSIDPVSSGFAVNQAGGSNINTNGDSYIFYAIA
jgi:hypothetical protein